jgi:hypothetical protein
VLGSPLISIRIPRREHVNVRPNIRFDICDIEAITISASSVEAQADSILLVIGHHYAGPVHSDLQKKNSIISPLAQGRSA